MPARPDPMRVGIVGVGAIAEAFITTMQQRFSILDVRACASRDPARARAAGERFGLRAASVDDLLGDPDIDLVVNLTPPAGHVEVIGAALEAGKHVYSEKVMATSFQDARDLVALADRHGLELGVSPDTILGSAIQNARQLVDSGLIGSPTSVQASLTRNYRHMAEFLPYLTQRGGDIGIDVAVYHLTALVYLLGPISSVFGFSTTNDPVRAHRLPALPHFGEEYTVTATTVTAGSIRFASGVLGSVRFDADSIRNQRPRLEIAGTSGVLDLANPDDFGGDVRLQREGQDVPVVVPSVFGMTENLRGAGVAEMAWSIRTGRKPRCGKEMALHVLEALLGLDESERDGRPHRMTTTVPPTTALPPGHVGDPFIDDIESAFAE